ncbi:MAG TPA: nuclear transport factor 2 family protein [Gemmatimonadales bacterium]|nr:nuclear transport factor 2 family protein [Gemmatimonadales bacterium]
MDTYAELIRRFYDAFARRDHAAMAACYAPEAKFHDPVFGHLEGWRIAAMWRMLCERATDLSLTADQITADGERGSAHWEARYTFSATGRRVHNVIEASFRFADGRIIDHVDRFDLYRWSRQALGWKGWLLGWSPVVQNSIRSQASRGLESFIRKQGLGP